MTPGEEVEGVLRTVLPHCAAPYRHQTTFASHVLAGHNAILAVGTGAGKTEAALVPALMTNTRVILVYPTKALLQDQRARVAQIAAKLVPRVGPQKGPDWPQIAVDTGDEDTAAGYSADIVLTNLDKLMYRVFGYGKRRWGFIYPFRLGFSARSRSVVAEKPPLLVFDEAHVYDDVIFSHFAFLIHRLTYEKGIQTLLLSATLPEALISFLVDSDGSRFPRTPLQPFFEVVREADPGAYSGQVTYRGHLEPAAAVERAVSEFRAGKRVAVVFPRVRGEDGLLEWWARIKASLADDKGRVLVYHGQQWPGFRRHVLDHLKCLDEAGRDGGRKDPYLLLTTPALEVGVDISADVLFSGPQTPAGFVQQVGRCARRKEGGPGEAYLMAFKDKELERVVERVAECLELGQVISPQVKACVNALNTPPDVESVSRRMEYILDEALYRYVYDMVPENRELWEQGLPATRDWEPTVTVVRQREVEGRPLIGGIPQDAFVAGKPLAEEVELPVHDAAAIAPQCLWAFRARDPAEDSEKRLIVGLPGKYTVEEALNEALGPGAGKRTTFDARSLPLTLVVPEPPGGWDEEAGLAGVERVEVKGAKISAPWYPGYERKAVAFVRQAPGGRINLRWYQPREEED